MNTYSLDRLLHPKTIALVGANEKNAYAGKILRNLINLDYAGRIYPVNPNYQTVFGLPCYPNLQAIPDTIDLAIIVIKANLVVDTARQCGELGVGGLLIITAGFRELDPVEGAARERQLLEIAQQYGMPMIGPNCIGFANVYDNLWPCGISDLPKRPLPCGNTAIISQSGAAGFGPLLSVARDRKIGVKYIITSGNESVLNMCDYLEYCLADPDIRSVALLIEGFRDSRRFIEMAKLAKSLGKALIVLKSGESEVGQRAAKSHTASMTGNMAVFNAMARQYGVIKAEDYDELIELARMTQHENSLRSKRVCVVSHSGGISGFTGDQLGKHGFDVPVFSEETRSHIDRYLKGFGSPNNPLDLTGQMRSENITDILLTAEKNEDIHAFVISSHGGGASFENVLNAIRAVKLPVYFNWTGSMYDSEGINKLLEMDIPVSFSIEKTARMLSKLVEANNAPLPGEEAACVPAAELPEKTGFLSEPEAKALLAQIGVPVPRSWPVDDEASLLAAWDEFPEGGKGVLKIVSDTILHKTDLGGVVLGIDSLEALRAAYARLEELRKSNDEISGFVLEEMCGDGLDMIVGIRQDEQYGPTLVLGLGGIYTELFKMISIRLVPVDRHSVEAAIDEIPGLPKLLAGYRGHGGYDREALVDAIGRLSDLVAASKGAVSLLEINPMRVMDRGQGVRALDCVMEIKAK